MSLGKFLVSLGQFLVSLGQFLVSLGKFLVSYGQFLVSLGHFFFLLISVSIVSVVSSFRLETITSVVRETGVSRHYVDLIQGPT